MTNVDRSRRAFSPVEKTIIIVQVVLALGFGFLALLEANDPDWGDLQRVVIFMLMTVWVGGIVGSVLIARLVNPTLIRISILVVAPFAGLVLIAGWPLLMSS